MNDFLGNNFLLLTCPQNPPNLICLTIFVNRRLLTQFSPKTRTTNSQKALKFVLLDNYSPDLFTEVQIWYWKIFKFGLGSLNWYLGSGLIRRCRIQWWFSDFFFLLDWKYPFCVNLVQKFKILSLSWNEKNPFGILVLPDQSRSSLLSKMAYSQIFLSFSSKYI